MQDQVLILDQRLLRLDRLSSRPDVAVVPLESALKVIPATELRDISSDAEILAEMRLEVDAEAQVKVVIVTAYRAVRNLALFTSLHASFTLRGFTNLGNAEHLTLLVEGLASGKGLGKVPLLGHILDLFWRCTYLGCGRI